MRIDFTGDVFEWRGPAPFVPEDGMRGAEGIGAGDAVAVRLEAW